MRLQPVHILTTLATTIGSARAANLELAGANATVRFLQNSCELKSQDAGGLLLSSCDLLPMHHQQLRERRAGGRQSQSA